MAFLGRLNSVGDLVDCEVFHGSRSKIQQPQQSVSDNPENHDIIISPKNRIQNKCSRTFIKTYECSGGSSKAKHMPGSPRTVRYVPSSSSSIDMNSMAETETSTLRGGSTHLSDIMETETETETLRLTPSTQSRHSSVGQFQLEEISVSNHEMNMELDVDKDSITSVCSWEEALSHQSLHSQDDSPSICVPSLTLESEAASESYHQHYHMDELKLERPVSEAYDNWLSAKRQQIQYKHQAIREKQEKQKTNAALRQQLSEKRYREWCKRKAEQSKRRTQSVRNNGHFNAPQRNDDNSQYLHAWELQKVKQAEQLRQHQRLLALRREKERFQRKQKSEQAFQQWMKNVDERPKPVPLNQGLKSLRGTISNIFINPNQWVD